jgi:hypothetical protein
MKYEMNTVVMSVFVTDKGPIDGHQPGADVSAVYKGDTLERLVNDGYLTVASETPVEHHNRRKRTTTAEVATESHIDAVADDGSEDGE